MASITFEYNTSIFGSLVRGVTGLFASVSDMVGGYFARRAAEQRLASLDDRLLNDIGIERADIHDMVWGK